MATFFLRYIWPRFSTCPACGTTQWRDAGKRGSIAHRRCQACRQVYKIAATHVEEQRSGLRTGFIRSVVIS